MADKEKIGPGMSSWVEGLREVDPELAKRLDESREIGFRNIERLGLPCYKRIKLPIGEFLENPDKYFDEIASPKFFLYLQPKHESRPIRDFDLDRKAAVDFVKRNVPPEKAEDYDLILIQNFEMKYGGNIVINPNGRTVVEIRRGGQGPVSWGRLDPSSDLSAFREDFTSKFKYSSPDPVLRSWVQKVLDLTPGGGQGLPGYYEFQIIERDGSLEPIFLDYRSNPEYNLRTDDPNNPAKPYGKRPLDGD